MKALLYILFPACVFALGPNTWQHVTPGGETVIPTGYDSLYYVSAIQRSVMLAQFKTQGTEQNRSWVGYSYPLNRWDVYSMAPTMHDSEGCNGHPVGAYGVDSASGVLYGTGCYSGSNVPDISRKGPYAFDLVGGVGRLLQTSSTLEWNAAQAVSAFVSGKLWVHGDSGNVDSVYDPSGNTFDVNASGFTCTGGLCPSTAGRGAMAVRGSTIYYYQSPYVYTLNVSTRVWKRLTTTGSAPSTRTAAGFAYSTAGDFFLLHGGIVSGSPVSDTFQFDPATNAWSELSPSATPGAVGSGLDGRLAYDATEDAFIAVHTTIGNGLMNLWVYRASGTGSDPGYSSASYSVTSGSRNRSTSEWAMGGSIAVMGSDAYIGWLETGNTDNDRNPRPYASKIASSGAVTTLGTYSAMGSAESSFLSLANVNGTLWGCWNEGIAPADVVCKAHGGGATWTGGTIGYRNEGGGGSAFLERGKPQIADVANKPTVSYIEEDRALCGGPYPRYLNVKQYAAASWGFLGTHLNTASCTTVDSAAIASDGTNPGVAFTQYTVAGVGSPLSLSQSNPQVHLKTWNGATWTECGTSGNADAVNGIATDVSIAYMGGQFYAAWVERTQGNPARVMVRTCSGGVWSDVGTLPLNQDATTGWAWRPRIRASGTTLYAAWAEQQAFGQKPAAYLAELVQGGEWALIAGPIYADSSGAVTQPDFEILADGNPMMIWGERKDGTLRQIYTREILPPSSSQSTGVSLRGSMRMK